ncbi:hypothetical protein BP5796_12424 [Coleophoma crateriformis]|uniref:Cytochrome P450 n=1 Tax=Coleophoma crateriformis TaxID=565419 RepID=A0A3D8QAJ7_9HELO|nr:hypothetical protein BP5796_12424 [Coleophoma crateriformis]
MANVFESSKSFGSMLLEKHWSMIDVYVFGAILSTIIILREAYRTNFPKVANIPEVPGSYPFVGHLPYLGGRQKQNDATIYSKWSRGLGKIFQMKLGDQRVVVVNTWETMKDFWITNNQSMMDRPFHKGFLQWIGVDISGSPMTPVIKKCRAAAVRALGKPLWPGYYKLIEPNSVQLVKTLYEKGKNGKVPMEMYPWLRQMMLDLTLNLTYGARAGDFDDELTNNLLNSLYAISAVRGSTATYRHFVPFLRIWPRKTDKVREAIKERRRCIDILYSQYLQKVADGEAPTCIVSSLGAEKLTLEELHGTCTSLLQAAPDTTSSGIYQCCAWLCSPEGQSYQKVVLDAILDTYNGDRNAAWNMAFREEKVPEVTSLYKESLRYFSTAPFNNRRTSQEIKIYGTTIPKGMGVTMNIQAVNHDQEHYGPDAMSFIPRRFIGDSSPLPHLSFGTGARICPAYMISNRILYAVLLRLILAFEMKQVKGTRLPSTDMIDFSDAYGLVAMPRSYDCSFVARDELWLNKVCS